MSVIKTDTYTGADGTNLNTIGYTHNQGSFQINTNAAASNTASTETATHDNVNTYPNDQYSKGTVVALTNGGYIGPAVRCAAGATATWYEYYTDSVSDATLAKIVGGVWTSLATGAAAASTDLLYIEVQGTAVLAKKNGVNQFGGAVTDSAIASGSAGLAGYNNFTGSRIDNTEFGDFGTASTFPPVPYFFPVRISPLVRM